MRPNITRQERHGWPSQARPDAEKRRPGPWNAELLLSVDRIHHPAPSPDGKWIAFVWDRGGTSDIWLLRTTGGSWPTRLTWDRPAQTFWTDAEPRWSPDSSCIAYEAEGTLYLSPVPGGRPKKLTDYDADLSSPVFSPDGVHIYFVDRHEDTSNLFATSPDGAWPVALTRLDGDVSDPQVSPDSRQVAFVYHPPSDLNRSEICLVPAAGGLVQHLTGAPKVWDVYPRWSPDGRQLAFLSNRSGWRQLLLLDPSSGSIRALTQVAADVQTFDWSPDGRWIAYVVNRSGSGELWMCSSETGEARALCTRSGWHSLPRWLPDGAGLIVEFESPQVPPDLWRIDSATGQPAQLTDSMPAALRAASLVMPEFVRYPSSGDANIPGFLFRPMGASATNRCPALVYPHGGPTSEYVLRWDVVVQWLVAKGYAVLAPNYRGSTGYGVEHQHALHNQWGIVDCDDMLAAADFLPGLEWVDGERLGIFGASYGSYLALLALARDPHPGGCFKCGVLKYGDCDILTSWAQGDRVGREDMERQMGHPTTNRAGYRAASPVFDVEKIRRPLLIIHGDQDERVHPQQSEELVEALKRAGKTFEFYLYQDEGHGMLQRPNLLHFYQTLERFLDWYLL
ncbi:MAG: S9 family peptidase [Chloroflexota bacterium]